MGTMSLFDFRGDVQAALGERGFSDARLNRWINFGYLDLTGAVQFEELNKFSILATVIGQREYATPARVRLLQSVARDGGDLLDFVDRTEFFRLVLANGTAVRWTRIGTQILLHPTPDSVENLTQLFTEFPALLAADADVTVIPTTWDAAVFLLAVHHGFLAIGEDDRALAWLSRAVQYIRARVTDDELFVKETGLGLALGLPPDKRAVVLTGLVGGAGGSPNA